MLWAVFTGFLLLLPMQPWFPKSIDPSRLKPLGAAHVDWIVLSLMLGLATGYILIFDLTVARLTLYALVFGALMNPLPYVFRAFGINAFVLAGPPYQIVAALLGLTSSLAILIAWLSLIFF